MEYRLDLNTLLLMLGQSTGSLYSELQQISGVKGRYQVFLRLEKGSVKSCSVMDERENEVASGETAVKLIQNQVLEWHYTGAPNQPPQGRETPRTLSQTMSLRAQTRPLRQSSLPALRSPIPRRTYPIPQHEFLLWPRLYRSVYSLIDGHVSVDYIVRLLKREQGVEKIREVFIDLQRSGLITFD
jgi:hypothetical protein